MTTIHPFVRLGSILADAPNPADCPHRQCNYHSPAQIALVVAIVIVILLVVAAVAGVLIVVGVRRSRRRRARAGFGARVPPARPGP